MPKTTAKFATIDIKRGRKAVAKIVADKTKKIPITLHGYILGQWSGDDGTSIEFQIDITSHSLQIPIPVDRA